MKGLLWTLQAVFLGVFLTSCGSIGPDMAVVPAAPLAPAFAPVVTPADVVRYADELDFSDPRLVAAVAQVESNYRAKAKNVYKGVTYYGLMQISYQRAHLLGFRGKPRQLLNWRTNVKFAAMYLAQLRAEHGTLRKTIAAYNAGTVYYCETKCPRGHLVNERYVREVMKAYKNLDDETDG